MVVNDKVPAKNLAEFIAFAKANPGKLNYGSAGSGTAPHLAVELFSIQTGESKLRQRGLEPAYLDPAQTGELMRRDVARWHDVANRVKLSLD